MPHPLYEVVAVRANRQCEYCRAPERIAGYPFEVEHVIATARGGTDALMNLALSCGFCNRAKGVRQQARDPVTSGLVPLFNPRLDSWDEHFQWEADYTKILGRTPVGRATVAALRLNSIRRQDARILWRALAAVEIGNPPFTWP